MFYFIPAWYKQDQWCENEQTWYTRRMHSEFDDTVKQIQLFHRNTDYPYQIMLLSFAPNFRHFLHRQGVYHASYWSCFDGIQEIRRKKAAVLSFHNLNWPSDIEFIYTQFVVVALLKGEKYAQIDFGEDGNPIRINLYKNDKICRCNIYDDRGFVSSTIVYEEEEPIYQDYLMESGAWKVRYFYKDGHVEVNSNHPEYLLLYQDREQNMRFSRMFYDSIDQVLCEVLTAYLKLTDEGDIFCAAMHEHHTELLKKVLWNKKLILSLFGERYPINNTPEFLDMIKRADYIIVDSRQNLKKIRWEAGGEIKNIVVITPYDSRMDFGISQQFKTQKILVPVDDINDEIFRKLICLFGEYLSKNKAARIYLFTRKANFDRKKRLLEQVRKELRKAGLEEGWAEEAADDYISENSIEPNGIVPIKFFVEQCVDELSVNKCMREQRLLIDMRNVPELYLQIMAISIGIPQIVRMRTEFVRHGKNGIVLKEIEKLSDAMDYFLNSLANWNEAMVYSYELGKEYTTGKLLEKWKEVIESIG